MGRAAGAVRKVLQAHNLNEAEARAPRMQPKMPEDMFAELKGFNEAEARAPRMLDASMR